MTRVLRALVRIPFVPMAAWWTAALAISGPEPSWLRTTLAIGYAVAVLVALFWVRSFVRSLVIAVALFVVAGSWWSTLTPSNDRDWAVDVAQIPWGEIHGDLLTLHNVRNFDYRSETDVTPRWETRTYDLSKLQGLDLFMSYWGSPMIAHTIMSWDFADGQNLAVSIETRREKTETYSAIRGFFRQYELCYVAADERDLVRLRTNYRGEEVYLYRLKTPLPRARAILLDYVATMNALAARAEFYNALTHNCTTTIRMHTRQVGDASPFDWRLIVNGYADMMLYERGAVDRSLPFPELKERSHVNARAKAADQDPAFSARIRDGLPPR